VNTLTSRPSRIRWLILALLFLISVITYIDRVNISVTARRMMPAYGMTDLEMGQEKGAERASLAG
jgi:ACS family glucarate transporter-like MFS transporter